MEETALSSITQNLFNPRFLKSFRAPFQAPFPVVYIQHSSSGTAEEIDLDELYPFMTVQDIKTYIYIKKDKDPEYHPSKQALLIPVDPKPSAAQVEEYIPLDFAFVDMGKREKVLHTHQLLNP